MEDFGARKTINVDGASEKPNPFDTRYFEDRLLKIQELNTVLKQLNAHVSNDPSLLNDLEFVGALRRIEENVEKRKNEMAELENEITETKRLRDSIASRIFGGKTNTSQE